jgi:hypothetical protein
VVPRRYAGDDREPAVTRRVAQLRPEVLPPADDSNGYGPPAVRPASELVVEPAASLPPIAPAKPIPPSKPVTPAKPIELPTDVAEPAARPPFKLWGRRLKVQVVRGIKSRRLVRRLDVWTVLKVSVVFYALAVVSLLVAGVILWNLAATFGVVHSIEKSVRTLFDLKTFTLHPGAVLGYAVAAGALLCVVGVMLNVIAALLYNLISDVVGGIQVVVVSEPD